MIIAAIHPAFSVWVFLIENPLMLGAAAVITAAIMAARL